MRVLVFGLSSQRGGVESFIITYCNEILRLDPTIHFDFLVIGEKPQFLSEYQNDVLFANANFYVAPNRMQGLFAYKTALTDLFETEKFDLLWYNVCTLSDITPLSTASHFSVPAVVHSHNSENMGNILNGCLHKFHKKLVNRYGVAYLACSDEAGSFMYPADILQSSHYTILANAIQTSRFTFNPTARKAFRNRYCIEDDLVFGHVGRFHPQKNHLFLLDIFKALTDDYPDSKLLLVGDGNLEQVIIENVKRLGIEENIIFAGQIKNVEDAYSAMDCFIFPSLYEGFGLAPLEAQAEGLPCVISDKCPPIVQIQPYCKRLSLLQDPSKWASEISDLMQLSPLDRSICSEQILNLGFDVSISAKKLIRVFYSAINREPLYER